MSAIVSEQTKKYLNRYSDCQRLIMSKWLEVLTVYEVVVLQFINERTYRYGKRAERIPVRHFSEGVYSSEGVCVSQGLPIGKTKIKQCINRLELLSIIQIKHGDGKRYECNIFAINFNLLKKGAQMPSKLKEPKVKQGKSGGRSTTMRGSPRDQPGGRHATTEVLDSKDLDLEVGEITASSPKSSTMAVIESAVNKNKAKRKSKATRIDRSLTLDHLVAAWREAMAEHYDSACVTSMTIKQFGKFKAQMNKAKLSVPISEIISWAVADWANIKKHHLSWVKDMPDVPDLMVLGQLVSYFVKAYGNVQAGEDKHSLKVDKNKAKNYKIQKDNERLKDELERERAARKKAEAVALVTQAPRKVQPSKHHTLNPVDDSDHDFLDTDELPDWANEPLH